MQTEECTHKVKRSLDFPSPLNQSKRICKDPQPTEDVGRASQAGFKGSLETLPPDILDRIFHHVQSYDLVKLARVSRSLHMPAVKRVYNTLALCAATDPYSFEEEHKRSLMGMEDDSEEHPGFTENQQFWVLNYGTFVPVYNIEKLVSSIENNARLAALVHSVSIDGRMYTYPIHLYSKLLSLVPNLKSLHDKYGLKESKRALGELENVTCTIDAVPKLGPRLVNFRLIDNGEVVNIQLFKSLALDFIKSGAHVNLRKVQFLSSKRPNYRRNPLGPHKPAVYTATWPVFLCEFGLAKIKLKLTSLGVSGKFPAKSLTMLLADVVELGSLRTLVLNHNEKEPSRKSNPSFLEMVTKHTPLLENLVINPTDAGMKKDIKAICTALADNIPHQLKELCVTFFAKDEVGDRQEVQDAIVATQKNLVKLRLEDSFTFVLHEKSCIYQTGIVGDNMEEDWLVEIGRQEYFPEILDGYHNRPAITNAHSEQIEYAIDQIHEGVTSEEAYYERHSNMTSLTQLFVGRVFVDVKQRGIFVNDRTVLFKTAEDAISTMHEDIVFSDTP